MKFKLGDKVKLMNEFTDEIGIITDYSDTFEEINYFVEFTIFVKRNGKKEEIEFSHYFKESELILIE